MGLVVIMLCGVAVDAAIVKRSYSDQSVRGYLTEVGIIKMFVCLCILII